MVICYFPFLYNRWDSKAKICNFKINMFNLNLFPIVFNSLHAIKIRFNEQQIEIF